MYDHIVDGKTIKVDKYRDGPFELQFKNIRAYGVGDKAQRDSTLKFCYNYETQKYDDDICPNNESCSLW